eukprot:m.16571 g.16571  ORF g.16571 m.16571 type:complete len:472 (+) comp10997_c0_seq1:217-1632(+)
MPELPEVEATRRMIAESITGLVVKDVCAIEQGGGPRTGLFDDIIICEDQSEESIRAALKGKQVDNLGRKGKQMWINFSNDTATKKKKKIASGAENDVTSLLIHLGMTGALLVNGKAGIKYKNFDVKDPVWPPRFAKLTITFANNTSLAFVDPRRLGRVLLRVNNVNDTNPVAGLAPDAFNDDLCPIRVHEICSKTTAPMKALLLDQHRLVSGVGNWVCDDVLYHCGIHPEASGNSLQLEDVHRLVQSLQHICREACSVDADHDKFPKHWLFHSRWRKGAKGQETLPDGRVAMFSTVAGRTTCHIPAAQKKTSGGGLPNKAKNTTKVPRQNAPNVPGKKGVQNKRKRRAPDASEVSAALQTIADASPKVPQRRGKPKKTAAVKRTAKKPVPAPQPQAKVGKARARVSRRATSKRSVDREGTTTEGGGGEGEIDTTADVRRNKRARVQKPPLLPIPGTRRSSRRIQQPPNQTV